MTSYQKLDMKRRNTVSPVSLRSMQTQLFSGNIVFGLASITLLMIIGFLINGNIALNAN
jgi:hypothetical protein